MVKLERSGEGFASSELYRLEAGEFSADQQTPVLIEDHLYGIIPGGELACLELNGKRLWTSDGATDLGLGPMLAAQGMLYSLEDQSGMLRLAEASPTGYRELASAKVLDGHDAWGPMALADGRLILRDLTQLLCLDVSEGGAKP